MTVCSMTGSKVKVTSPSKLEILFSKLEILFLNSVSSAIYNGSWQLTTDSLTRAQYLNLIGLGFLIFILVFLSRDFELGRNVTCKELTISPVRGNFY